MSDTRPLSPIMASPPADHEISAPPHFSEKASWRLITTLLWTVLLAIGTFGLVWYAKGVNDNFLSPRSLENTWVQLLPVLLLVGPMAVIMLGGGLDLSIGAVIGLTSVLTARVMSQGGSPDQAFITAMSVAGGIGLLHALLICVTAINPIVLTLLTTVLIHSGAMLWAAGETHILVGRELGFLKILHQSPIAAGVSLGLSLLLIQLAQIGGGAGGLPIPRQRWYRRVFFIGLPYVLSALAAGFVGCSMVGRMRVGILPGDPHAYALMVLIAAVIGGNCVARRFGTVIGAVWGAAILVVLQHVLILEAVSQAHTMLIIASTAGGALLLSQLLYWIINLIYRGKQTLTA